VNWLSVNHAIFLCDACNQIHNQCLRGLSRTKPLSSTDWGFMDMQILVYGGNPIFKEYLSYYSVPMHPLEGKYKLKACYFYRERVCLSLTISQITNNKALGAGEVRPLALAAWIR